jgi:sialic acid synthase SpsE
MGNIEISNVNRPIFIADIAANHDGDIDRAFKLIELASEAGADAAKFQNFKAEKIVSKSGFDKIHKLSHQSKWDKSVYEVYKDASIDVGWTKLLKEKCESVGIEYMSTPYDFDSLEIINPYSNAIKIGSGDITWHDFLVNVSCMGKPVMISTGASNIDEVILAHDLIKKYNEDIVIFQCNTNYTGDESNYDSINLNVLNTYKNYFPDAILGLSDHTPGHTTVLGAIALGARVIEKHFTDDNDRIGPDHSFSMNPYTWRVMVDESLKLWRSLGNGIKKCEINEMESVLIQRRGSYLKHDLDIGEPLLLENIEFLRPISPNGIPPYKLINYLGRRLMKEKRKNDQLFVEDFE